MSLKQILQNKDKKLTGMLNKFDAEFDKFSIEVQKKLKALFSRGIFDKETINAAFAESGYSDLVNAWVNNYAEVITFNKQVAKELGIDFILTRENIRNFETLQGIHFDRLNSSMTKYADELRAFGYEYSLGGRSFRDIAFKNGVDDLLKTMGRSASAEAYTGIGIAESTIKKDWYDQAGIEKYVYMGPRDGKTRYECRSTLGDSRQSTGWTLDQINSSETPFISRGGWNCRHEWLPFVEDMPVY